jgi:hypothetical protein
MGPFKCPDCGVWWAGFEHRCPPTATTTGGNVTVNDTVVCTCPKPIDWSKTWIGDPPPCPVHRYPTTITYGNAGSGQ